MRKSRKRTVGTLVLCRYSRILPRDALGLSALVRSVLVFLLLVRNLRPTGLLANGAMLSSAL